MAPHSSTLACKIPWMEEPGRLRSVGLLRVGHNWATSLSLSHIGEGDGYPLQCSCLENPRGGGAWWAAVYGVAQGQTWLKRLSSSSSTEESLRKTYTGQGPATVPSAGVSVSVEVGCVTLLVCGCVHQHRRSLNPMLLGVCGSSFTLHDQLLTPFLFQSPSSLWRTGGRAENFKHQIKQILRLVIDDHPGATRQPTQKSH